jgi:hypothetical protein
MLVHAELIFKHVGLGLALGNALLSVAPGGGFSVVLQLPSEEEWDVASTSYTSLQTLKQDFHVDRHRRFQRLLALARLRRLSMWRTVYPWTKATRPIGSRLRWPMAFLAWQRWSIIPSCGSICRTLIVRASTA